MSVLDTIDTTVSLEFGETRTVGTLLELSGQLAVLTALGLPEEGGELNVVIEGDSPEESVTLDGICLSVSETAWGEQQAEVELLRVGTTCSASRLRDFIEQYGIARGGSVHIGQNRDDPHTKRFVYHVPDRLDGAFTQTDQGGIRGRRETVHFSGDVLPPSAAKSRFKSTDQMRGSYGTGGFEPADVDLDAGFDESMVDKTMPEHELDPRIFEAASVGVGEVGFGDTDGTTMPDRTLNTEMGSVGFGGSNDLDAALRDALASVEAPKLPGGTKPTQQGIALDFDDEPLEPTRQMDAIADLDPADPFANIDFDNLDALEDPLEPTRQLDVMGDDEPEPTRQMDALADIPGLSMPRFSPSDPVPELPDKPAPFQIPGTTDPDATSAPGAFVTDTVSPASLMADLDGDDDLPDEYDEADETLSDEEAALLMKQVDQAIAFERAIADSEYYDPNEQIVVNTVPLGVPFADPVKLGNDNKAPSLRNIAPAKASRRSGAHKPQPIAAPVLAAAPSHRRMSSDALQKVQSVFSVDFAMRTELAIQILVARKKRDGMLIRLSESRLRVRSPDCPRLYELIHVILPPPPGEKKKIQLRCEVTRIREPEAGGESAFDMRVSGGNSPKTMTALRALIKSFEAGGAQQASA